MYTSDRQNGVIESNKKDRMLCQPRCCIYLQKQFSRIEQLMISAAHAKQRWIPPVPTPCNPAAASLRVSTSSMVPKRIALALPQVDP